MSINTNPWQTSPPTEPGRWEMCSDETGRQPQSVLVRVGPDGALWADDPDIGSYPLDIYHFNLIAIEWRRCNPVAQEAYSELLAMPLPTTLNGFRQAIVMAVLIGRQIEADFQSQEQPTNPNQTDTKQTRLCKVTSCSTTKPLPSPPLTA